jgi:hypothetical protein
MSDNQIHYGSRYTTIVLFCISFLFFSGFYFFSIASDYQKHVEIVMGIAAGSQQPFPNFVYHLSIYIFSLLNLEFGPLFLASALVSALAVAAKYFFSHKYIKEYASGTTSPPNLREDKNFRRIIISFSVMLVFVFSLPITVLLGGDFYLLNFPPNVWHNPTTILLMPFAVILFWVSYRQLENPTSNRITAITLLCIINILIKPSFFFIFCGVYPLFFLSKHGFKVEFWKNMIPIIIGIALVYFEYYLLYAEADSSSGVAIGLFTVWAHYSPNIPLAFLGSIFFPIVYFGFYWRSLIKSLLFKYSVTLLALAVVVFSVLIETGSRKYHGNFAWQYIVANYILYMVIIALFVKRIYQSNSGEHLSIPNLLLHTNWKDKVILSIYLVQFILGIYYFINFYIKLGY